ncbi:hypothetical protein Desdi_3087 [Desulfitobacterium dichloroeliminans LMG P-21439]|uniref:DUF5667 domain-containing protein n=1 Tax=Desulfitobacterium dichloroeliminans (strain LMG P-21439 / DCA1) TaxID=871963 RepID=L0FCW1_DESDL|nr:DUF5667 domain-containing protein [Desulfitobacterium dichloroeliminans]AGA70491.1 hypothetical protein Desdi_3087 [Desulfitobacterium dichloroeliminans LMG P-21439]
MKKQIALILTAALMALPVSPVMVLADTTEETAIVSATEIDPGTLPDSPLYWLDELVEKLQVALTFDSQKKIKLLEEHANESMAEILALAKKVNDDEKNEVVTETEEATETEETEEAAKSISEKKLKAFEKALTRYNEKIANAQEILTQLENPESEEYKNLQEAFTKVNANNVIVLGGLLEKLPPQASQRLALNIVRSMEKAVDKMEKMEAKNQEEEKTTEDDVTETDAVDETTPGVEDADALEKENAKAMDKQTKEDYKALRKEAKDTLKQLQAELGLKGPDKDKENNQAKDDDNDQVRDNKEADKSNSDKNRSRDNQNDNKDKNARDRDDDRGNVKGSQEQD